ncbi:hypothetical protein OsI_28859 [Oryza sativa Indica Group]|uniref:Myb/SANT-like domain-containing protein n=1 Tax=Oryza sativa subsp. indica TaxID=39946 RepID=B8B9U9_ORYSI|nr:hypothetical protein OsI_28859 [Oryza sativa Indica Group]
MAGGRTYWDKALTKIFLDLCIAEKTKRNHNKKGRTNIGWQNLYRNFREQSGKNYDSKQLQNKFSTFKRQYKLWKSLKNKSGGGIGKRTPSSGSDDNLTPMSNDNVGLSSAGRVA